MKIFFSIIFAFFISIITHAQEMGITEAEKIAKGMNVGEEKLDTVKFWKFGSVLNINFSQVTLSNWLAGGQNSITLTAISNSYANYVFNNTIWKNSLELGYGLSKLQDINFRKSDDRIVFISNYSVGHSPKFKYSALLDFRTQFSQGFNYTKNTLGQEESIYISNFLAPGYLIAGTGVDYFATKYLNLFFSPITYKGTYVLDDSLSAKGAFGVSKGTKTRAELGLFLTTKLNLEIMKNVNFKSNLNLFSNYTHFEKIDVIWENLLTMKVNKLIEVTFSNQMFYDDDVRILGPNESPIAIPGLDEPGSPKLQYKQVLNVGVSLLLK